MTITSKINPWLLIVTILAYFMIQKISMLFETNECVIFFLSMNFSLQIQNQKAILQFLSLKFLFKLIKSSIL